MKRKKHSHKKTNLVVGYGYFQREQYQLLLDTAADRAKLCDTYDEWLDSFRKAIINVRKAGIDPVKVDVDMKRDLETN